METRRGAEPVISITMACLMIMLLVESCDCAKSSFAQLSDCYGARYSVCSLKRSRIYCAGRAMSDCAMSDSRRPIRYLLSAPVSLKQRYCELGCGITQCSQFDPNAIQQLAKCFESCSENTCKPKVANTADEQTYNEFCKLGCANSICGVTADKNTTCGSCATACS